MAGFRYEDAGELSEGEQRDKIDEICPKKPKVTYGSRARKITTQRVKLLKSKNDKSKKDPKDQQK